MTPSELAVLASAIAALIGAVAAVISAIFAGVAVRSQRAAQRPHVKVTHTTPMPVWSPVPGSFAGSALGDPFFCIVVHNDGLLPVTVNSAGLEFSNRTSAPFVGAPRALGGIGDGLPKRLDPGEAATLYLDPLRQIAEAHVEQGGARWVTATLAGGREFHGPPISKSWLDGWAKPSAE